MKKDEKGKRKKSFDKELYDKLNSFRNLIFRYNSYYTNNTLKLFATELPTTKEEILEIDPNEAKFDSFGLEFIKIIKSHISAKEDKFGIVMDNNLIIYSKIMNFEERLYEIIRKLLEKEYQDKWWYEGVPKDIRKKAAELHEDFGGNVPKEYCLYLMNLKEIIKNDWVLFSPLFDPENKGKNEFYSWFDRLNNLRNKVSHRMRLITDPIVEEDLLFVIEKSQWIDQLFNDMFKD